MVYGLPQSANCLPGRVTSCHTPKSSNVRSTSPSSSSNTARTYGLPKFKIVWPQNYKKRLETVTIERVYEADVTPAVGVANPVM